MHVQVIIKDIMIGKNLSYTITRFQFISQLVVTRTIHRAQRLSLDEFVFDPTNVKKHGVTYTTLSNIQTISIYLFIYIFFLNFNVD